MSAVDVIEIDPEVADALAEGRGVVALESTIISQGLPTENSAEIARQIEAAVRESGAVPATIAVVDGRVRIGLDEAALERIATDEAVVKASIRDLGMALATGRAAATTVASTSYLADQVGIGLFATGGLGGVHRGAQDTWDQSADLPALGSVPMTVVCAGVKSILDVPATLERLETLSVALVGYRTDMFPGFYIRDSGELVPWRVESPAEIAAVMAQRTLLGLQQALVVANPIPEAAEMDQALHDETLTSGLEALVAADVHGKDVTPFLLAYFHEQTHGRSLDANVALVLSNARLAGEIAVAASTSAPG
ncbi:MAG: pseudouridine-5'-phosphate glycosidase [Nocardioidaceae bacterium]